MSEAGFTVFENMVAVLETLIYAGGLAYFFHPFMTRKREPGRSKQKKVLIVFVAYSLIYFAGMMFSVWDWLCMVLTLIIFTAASKYLDMDRKICFLLLIFFHCIKNISPLISESLYHLLSEKFVWGKTQKEIILRNTAVAYGIYIMAVLLIFAVKICLLKKRISDCKLELHVRELCHMGLIPVAGVLFVNVIRRLFIIVQGNEIFQLYVQYPAFLGIVPLIAIILYAGIIATVMSYRQMVSHFVLYPAYACIKLFHFPDMFL